MAQEKVHAELGSLADRINYLFAELPPADGARAEFTNQYVLTWLRERGHELSPSHISELRRGIKVNPTMKVLQGLADFFEVRAGFFHGDVDAVRDTLSEVRLRRAMRDNQVTDIAARVAGLSPPHRHLVADFITDMIYKHGKDGGGSAT